MIYESQVGKILLGMHHIYRPNNKLLVNLLIRAEQSWEYKSKLTFI